MYNILDKKELSALKKNEPKRFKYSPKGGAYFSKENKVSETKSRSFYLDLRGLELSEMEGIDVERINHLAKIVRGFAFAAIDGIKSGHPGGSSSKVEQILTLLFSGIFAFDPMDPKNPGRSRIVWSAGHCTPLSHSVLALIYTALQKSGIEIDDETKERLGAVRTDCLARFRHCDGPSGHMESRYALADASTGSSGHGFSAALGLAVLQKSNGLDTKVFVMAGDAETEEGMSYEARNAINSLGMNNLIVSLDYNLFGIDGPIAEVINSPYINSWFGSEWNIIEVDGHNVLELAYAYKKAVQGFGNDKATVIICHTIKGKEYGKMAGTADSHGTPAPHDEYVQIMKNLGFSAQGGSASDGDIPGIEGETLKDIEYVASFLSDDDVKYILGRMEESKKLIEPEEKLKKQMEKVLAGRTMADYKSIKRPEVLPPELVFKEGEAVATRKATEAFFKWLMGQTAFFYLGSGDLMKSILTGAAENVYGIINKDNPFGRGIRFGIAEQNMAMMSATLTQDILPGGFQAMSVFASYGVFTSIMSNSVRMALIGNAVNPKFNGFFIMLAAHDGPETGEDGPTHHGLFWMSLFNAYPGIKVYKPLDANETIEMLFYAMERGEPVALSVMRPNTSVLKRGPSVGFPRPELGAKAGQENGAPPAREATNGAYVFKPFKENGGKKAILAISGGQTMANVLEVLPDLESQGLDIKIIAVTSPELFEELREKNPQKAGSILSDEERQYVITLHNGWPGFLNPFILPASYNKRAIGIDKFLKSGPPAEVYKVAEFDPQSLKNKILKALE